MNGNPASGAAITSDAITAKLNEISASPANTLKLKDAPAFDAPLVGIGAGDDPLFQFFKEDIGPFHMLPREWLALKYGEEFAAAEASVISWANPQTSATRGTNREQKETPSYDWALNRTFGEEFNRGMAAELEAWLNARGIKAVAPMANLAFQWARSEKYGYASNWSERHAAFVCGLGTFGLCDGLITKHGKAARFGSVIIARPLPPTPRPYTRRDEYCLATKGCRACASRCPAAAITPERGHDKEKCAAYQRTFVTPRCRDAYGFEGTYGCGLCQVGVPCEHRAPAP